MSKDEVEDLPVTAEDKETVVVCTKCGKEFDMAFDTDLDLEEDSDLYKELLKDHEFMCSSDFPDFEVKEKSETKYVELSDAEEAIKEARKQERQQILDKIEDKMEEYQDYIDTQPSETLRNKQIAVLYELSKLRDDLKQEEEEVEEA